jgi:hypothetical protein
METEEHGDLDSAGVYFISVEDFESRADSALPTGLDELRSG